MEKKEQFLKDWNYLLGRLNFAQSPLDCRSIQFMNEFPKRLNEVISEEVEEEMKTQDMCDEIRGKYPYDEYLN